MGPWGHRPMCDADPTVATRPRPRWRRLYAIASLAITAFAVSDLSVKAPALRIALDCAVAVAAWGATLLWIRANRVALDQLEWCDCTAKTVTVRVILSRPARPLDPRAAGVVVVAAGDPRGVESETGEPSVPVSR